MTSNDPLLQVMKDILEIQEQQVQQTKDAISRMEALAIKEEEGLLHEVVRQLTLDTESKQAGEIDAGKSKKTKRTESRIKVNREEREEKTWTGDLFAM
jgi:DNA-binding protein H-NS